MKLTRKTPILVAALALAPLASSHAAWVTFGNATGWTNDIIVGAGETGTLVNGTIDGGPGSTSGFTLYTQGANTANTTSGLPTSPTVSLTSSGASFVLQSPVGNNALFSAPNGTNTLTLATPTTLTQLALYGTTGNAGSTLTLTYTINYADSTTQIVTTGGGVAQDWFNNTTNLAYIMNGRTNATGTSFSNVDATPTSSSNPRIYETLLTLTNTTSPVVSVTVHNNGRTDGDTRGYNAILAISGNTVPEASSALLGLVGAFGLLRRRR